MGSGQEYLNKKGPNCNRDGEACIEDIRHRMVGGLGLSTQHNLFCNRESLLEARRRCFAYKEIQLLASPGWRSRRHVDTNFQSPSL